MDKTSTGGTVWRENTKGKTEVAGGHDIIRRKVEGLYIGRGMLNMALSGKRKRERRFMIECGERGHG